MPGDNASSTVCHTHNSSKNYRISALANIWGNYHCFTCKNTPHLHKIGTRYPFLVSSSILNNWQGLRIMNGYQGDKIHVDYITIPGATVKELEHPFLAEYSNSCWPIEWCPLWGYRLWYHGRYLPLQKLCKIDLSWDWRHLPQQSSRSCQGLQWSKKTIEEWSTTEGDLMVFLTSQIRESNCSDIHPIIPTLPAPCFHTWGIRTKKSYHFTKPKTLMDGWLTHRMGQWKETKPKDMLHLKNNARIRMGKTCIGYFKA